MDLVRLAQALRVAESIPTKPNGRPWFSIQGNDDGRWELRAGYDLGWRSRWTWSADAAMSSKNEWRNLSVDGATEHNPGLQKAFKAAVKEYPELLGYWVQFDGPYIPMPKVLRETVEHRRWETIEFYHGTSVAVIEPILSQGLRPRSETNVGPAYGAGVGATEGRREAVYLTTQLDMAKHAARQAGRVTKDAPVILLVKGIDGSRVAADEDSRETDPWKSLDRMGSIAYLGTIPPSKIEPYLTTDGQNNWVTV